MKAASPTRGSTIGKESRQISQYKEIAGPNAIGG